MKTSNTGPFGHFSYTLASESWWWSDSVYSIHGFAPGEIVPTTDLILAHKHPEDAELAAGVISSVLESGERFSVWHRIIDAQNRVRRVLSVGGGVRDRAGELLHICGTMVDLTEPMRRDTARDIDEAVRRSAESRAAIEQTKGAIMLACGVDEDTAFELLRRYSQQTNVKVRELAVDLTAEVANGGELPAEVRRAFDDLLANVENGSTSDRVAGQSSVREVDASGR